MSRGLHRRTLFLILMLTALSACGSRLHRAIWNGDVARVRELLDRGANPNNYVFDYGEPLDLAAVSCNKDIMRLLLDHGARTAGIRAELTLRTAVEVCDTGTVALLLERGFDANADYYLGPTILMEAVKRGNLEVITLLLDHGADPCARGRNSSPVDPHKGEENAREMTTGLGNADIVRLFAARGADRCPR